MERIKFFALLFTFVPYVNSEPPVLILAENLQQVVTSSTLQWVAVNSRQPKHFDEAVVGAYQIMQGRYTIKFLLLITHTYSSIFIILQMSPMKKTARSITAQASRFTCAEQNRTVSGYQDSCDQTTPSV